VVIGTAVATSLLLWSVSDAHSSRSLQQSGRARAVAHSCAEEVIAQLQRDTTYAAGVTLTIGSDSCSIERITGTGGMNRTIEVSGVAGTTTRRVRVIVDDIGPPTVVSLWQEVADF